MKLKTTAQVLEIVGPQEYSLANKGPVPGINPLEAWSAPSHKRIFTVDELYEIFSKECIAMIGDSTDRRAADTLHLLLTNRQNISDIQKYFHKYKNRYQDHTRVNIVDGVKRTKECFPGTIDNLFLPTYEKLLAYEHEKQKKYQIIVGATGPWNHRGIPKYYTPKETREYIQQVIAHLDKEIPDDVLFIWKTGVFSWFGEWNELQENETIDNPKGNNWLVHYTNQIAKESILALNSSRRIVLDFAAEIAPYSWEHRRTSNNMAEFDDYVPWHLGPKARVLFGQMLAWEVARYRNSTLLSTPGIDFGKGIEFGNDSAQNSNDTLPGSEANEIASASSSAIDDDDDKNKKQKTDAISTNPQVADPSIESSAHSSGTVSDSTSATQEPLVGATKFATTNALEAPIDSVTMQNYFQNLEGGSDASSMIRNLIQKSSFSFLQCVAVLLVLYGMRMKSRSKSRTRR